MAKFTASVAGVDRAVESGSLDVTLVANGFDRLKCKFDAASIAGFLPTMDDAIVITKDGSKLFGGPFNSLPLVGTFGDPSVPVSVSGSANDFGVYADRRYVNQTFPAGTTKADLILAVAILADLGVTLDGAQTDGPSLPELKFTFVKLTEVLNQIAKLAGGVWRIDADKKLSIKFPASNPAPFNVTASTVIGDATVEPTRNDFYANTIIGVISGTPTTAIIREYVAIADGVAVSWATNFPSVDAATYWPGNIYQNDVPVPIGPYEPGNTSSLWGLQWDPITHTVYQRAGDAPLTTGTRLLLIYGAEAYVKVGQIDTFTGDGSTTAFALSGRFVGGIGSVTLNGISEVVGVAGSTWVVDGYTNTIVRNAAPAMSDDIRVTYDAAFESTGTVTASDGTEVGLRGVWEGLLSLSPDTTPDVMAAEVAAELARRKVLQKHVRYMTYSTGLKPGMTQTITVPRRGLAGETYMISEVNIKDQGLADGKLLYTVTAIESLLPQSTWRDTVKQWGQTGGGSSISTPVAVTSGLTTGPAGPPRAGQYNAFGVFGGDGNYLVDFDGLGDVYGVDGLSARLAVGASTTVAPFSWDEKFAFGQSNTSFKTDGSVYSVYPIENDAQDANYPLLRITENVKVVNGVGPAGENVCQPWQVAGTPDADVSALVFDGFGNLSDTRFPGTGPMVAWVDYYLDAAQMTEANSFSPIMQIYGVTIGDFPATGTGAGQFPFYGSAGIVLAIYQTSGDTWTAELQYLKQVVGGSDNVTLSTYTFSKTAVQNAWHRFKIVWQPGSVTDWSLGWGASGPNGIEADGRIQAYMGATLLYDVSAERVYLSDIGTSAEANRVQAFAVGFDSLAGWVTNLHIGNETSVTQGQFALWNPLSVNTKDDAFTIKVNELALATIKSPLLIDVEPGLKLGDPGYSLEDQGTVFAVFGGGIATGGSLNFIDLEPGTNDLRTVPVGESFYGLYFYPTATTAASGTHGELVNVDLTAGSMTNGGATVTDAINVRIGLPPGGGALGASSNWSLKVEGQTQLNATTQVNGDLFLNGLQDMPEISAPSAPGANRGRFYMEDSGGKTRLMVRFPTGSAIQLAIEP